MKLLKIFLLSLLFQLFSICLNNSSPSSPPRIDLPSNLDINYFRPLKVDLRIPVFRVTEENGRNKLIMHEIILKIPSVISSLLQTKDSEKKIVYNTGLLDKLNVLMDANEAADIHKEIIKTDLLLIFEFVRMKNRIAKTKIYKNTDGDDTAESRNCHVALIMVNSNYDFKKEKFKDEFFWHVFREVFRILGYRKKYLKRQKIRNNFKEVPFYLIENSYMFKSYHKFLELTNQKYEKVFHNENRQFYESFWVGKEYDLSNDLFLPEIKAETTLTELTMSLINDIDIFSVNECDLFSVEAGLEKCFSFHTGNIKNNNSYGINKYECIPRKLEKNFFIEYGIYSKDEENFGVVCYLNSKEHFKNKQCGNLYGKIMQLLDYINENYTKTLVTIKQEFAKTSFPIPEVDLYPSQELKLLKNSELCPNNSPRSIYFTVPKTIFDDYSNTTNITKLLNDLENLNKNVQYDNVIIKDKKFFVTYQTPEDYYTRESTLSVLNNSGIIRSFSNLNSHNLLLKNPSDKDIMFNMNIIPGFQKIYCYIDFSILSYKDKTYTYYKKMKEKFPEDYNYLSETYLFPEEKEFIKNNFSDYQFDTENLWLIKPKRGSLGKGIYFLKNILETPNDFIITKYINHPHLIGKKKYDFRMYVLITGLVPLKIYLYKEGIVRFATKKYSLKEKDLSELYRHITNVNLNKKNVEGYINPQSEDEENKESGGSKASKWSLTLYEKYCKEMGIDYENVIRKQMADIAIKSILTVHDKFLNKIKYMESVSQEINKKENFEYQNKKWNFIKEENFFQLYGFDFLLDDKLKVHLIEINDRPSLIMNDINDRKLKPQLVADCLNIIGITPYSHDYRDWFRPYDNFENFDISKKLSIEEKVAGSLCEFSRPRGRFELIFPKKDNVDKYEKYFKEGIEENKLLWKKIKEIDYEI